MYAPSVPGFSVARMAVDDAEEWAAFAVLPEVTRLTSSTAQSATDLVPMIERSMSPDPNAPWLFSVRAIGSDQLVACVGFHTVSALNRNAEVTYTVHPAFWGRGIATAVCSGAVDWAFEHMRWVRVQATTLEEHLASQQVLLKCGFELEGRLRNFRIVRGEPRHYLVYSRIAAPESSSAAGST